jgi:hypothetical protein
MRRKLSITLLTTMMLFSLWQLTESVSAQQELSLAKILTGLQTQGKTPETSTLAARNIYITKRVQTYGVTFRLTTEIEKELRVAGASNALLAAIRANGPAAPTPTPYSNANRPSASFKDLWIDYDITEAGKKGMRIHVKFTAYAMKGLDAYLAIYFLDKNGNSLKDSGGDSAYASSLDTVAVYRELKPGYDPAEYADYTVFMPYAELDVPDGNHDLTMDVKLIYKAGGAIQDLTKKAFNYKQGNVAVCPAPSAVTAKSNRVWVDYNVTEGGKKGMRVHVNFEVTGLLNIDSLLTARVQKADGTFLTNSNSGYSNRAGELAVSFEMTPGFATTAYKDADIFIPYNEIIIGRGKWNLSLDIDVNCGDGKMLKHLDAYEFEFERP